MEREQVQEGALVHGNTSIRYWNAFRSLNLNELPIDIVYK